MAGFIDRVVGGVAKSVDSIGEGSKQAIEKAKLNMQIQDIEREVSRIFTELGSRAYNIYIAGESGLEQCKDICDEITARKKKISELKRSVQLIENPGAYRNVDGGVICVCGQVNKPEAKFCGNCGKQLETTQQN